MATKAKPDGAQMKMRRGTSPSPDQGKVGLAATKPSSSSTKRETSPSTSSEKRLPNYLKPTISSRNEAPKVVKKQGFDTSPAKPSLNRRRSFDRPLMTSSPVHKVLTSGPCERSLTVKSSSPVAKSATSAKGPVLESKSKLMLRSASSKAGTTKSIAPKKGHADLISKKEIAEPSDSVGGLEEHHDDIDVVVAETQQADENAEKMEERVDAEEVHELSEPQQQMEHEDVGKSAVGEFKDDVSLDHHEEEKEVAVTEKEHTEPQKEEVAEEKIDDSEHHEEEKDDICHKEAGESGKKEVEERAEESGINDEVKEVVKEEIGIEGSGKLDEAVPEVGEEIKGGEEVEESGELGQEDEEGGSVREVNTVKPETSVAALKNQKSMGKKDSPVYNDVIEETASKLLKKRKNKVRALVGAFETVISLQEPEA